MHTQALESAEPSRAAVARDRTDPSQGPHAIQLVLDAAVEALARAWSCSIVVQRANPLVSIDAALLRSVAGVPSSDLLLVRPGVVHPAGSRRGEGPPGAGPRHQVHLWRIRRGAPLGLRDLAEMIGPVAAAVVPGFTISAIGAPLPQTSEARRIDVRLQGKWVEIGRCGLVERGLLQESGLPPDASAMAMALDLDRLVMLAKGIDDVRLLRSRQRGVARQMLDLEPYVPVEYTSSPGGPAPTSVATLEDVREAIDDVDSRIVTLLAERRSYVIQAARFKKSVSDVRVPAREEQVIANVRAAATRAGIEPDLIEDLYRHVIDGLVRVEIAAHPGARA